MLLWYLLFINITAFFLMAGDKHRAKAHRWRIPEKILFASALLGGSIGAIVGMYIFHHKTRHLSFVIGMPVILVFQIVSAVYFLRA